MTSADDGATTPDLVAWVARQVIRQHETPPPVTLTQRAKRVGCAQCQPDGSCPMLAWARTVVGNGPPPDGQESGPPRHR